MRLGLRLYHTPKTGRKGLPHEVHQLLIDQRASERECFYTPSIQAFLNREDVVELQAKSGWYHIFVKTADGHEHYVGETLTLAVEKAMGGTNDGTQGRHPGSLPEMHRAHPRPSLA